MDIEAQTRVEHFLGAIAGVNEIPNYPEKSLTRVERFLKYIAEHGGRGSSTSAQGEFSIGGSDLGTNGYNNTSYRKITNVYDGENAHDALTVGQANALIDAINQALSANIAHIGANS